MAGAETLEEAQQKYISWVKSFLNRRFYTHPLSQTDRFLKLLLLHEE